MQDESLRQSSRSTARRWVLAASGGFLLLFVVMLFAIRDPAPYHFFRADHPVSMLSDATGTWTYYSLGPPANVEDLSAKARTELIQIGFSEDTKSKPWYRFTRGDREVIICNHNEIAVDQSKTFPRLFPGRRSHSTPKNPWPVVWVHQGGQNKVRVAIFQVQKTLFLW